MTCLDTGGAPWPGTPFELSVACAVEGHQLLLTYEVTNTGHAPLYFGLVPTTGTGQPRFGDVNRLLTQKDGLVLDLGPPPVPAGLTVYARAIPLSCELGAGDRVDGRIELSIPVLEYHSYCPAVDPTVPGMVEDATVKRARLRFWALRKAEAVFARPVPGYDDLVRAGGGPVMAPTCELALRSELAVWRRIDPGYWRA